MREFPARGLLVALLVPCIMMSVGCNLIGTDDTPDGSGTPEATESDNDIALGISGTAVDLLSTMFDAAGQINQAPGGLRWGALVYDDTDGQWTLSDTFQYEDLEADGTGSVTCTVQFLAGAVPQQYVDDATTNINIWVTEATNTGNYHPEGRAWNIDYDWTATSELHAAVNGDVVDVTGGGALTSSTQTHIGSATLSRSRNASWTYDLSMPLQGDGCPTGTFAGTVGDHAFSGEATAGSATWSVSLNGTVVGTETTSLGCGDPGNGGV
jgi:hypothetical protein